MVTRFLSNMVRTLQKDSLGNLVEEWAKKLWLFPGASHQLPEFWASLSDEIDNPSTKLVLQKDIGIEEGQPQGIFVAPYEKGDQALFMYEDDVKEAILGAGIVALTEVWHNPIVRSDGEETRIVHIYQGLPRSAHSTIPAMYPTRDLLSPPMVPSELTRFGQKLLQRVKERPNNAYKLLTNEHRDYQLVDLGRREPWLVLAKNRDPLSFYHPDEKRHIEASSDVIDALLVMFQTGSNLSPPLQNVRGIRHSLPAIYVLPAMRR
jgi:hypothetical protein